MRLTKPTTFAAVLALVTGIAFAAFAQQNDAVPVAPAPPPSASPAGGPAPNGQAAPAATPAPAAAPSRPPPAPTDAQTANAREKIEAARSALDSIDAALTVEGLRANDLDDLRQRLDPVRRELGLRSDEIAPRVADARSRLETLGPKPAEGAAPEDPALTADREQLQKITAELDAVLKQVRALVSHADQVSDRISSRRRALFTGQLFERADSILDPKLWTSAAAALGVEIRATELLVQDWSAYAGQRHGGPALAGILAGTLAIVVLVVAGGRLVRRRLRTPAPEDGAAFGRLRSAREALKAFFLEALVAPVAAFVGIGFVGAFNLIPPRAEDLVHGLAVAVVIKAVGTGVARALLAPSEPWRRLPPLTDRGATIAFRYFSFAVWTLAIAAFLNALHRALFVPVGLTVLTSAIMSLLIAGFLARFLVNLAAGDDAEPEAAGAAAPAEQGQTVEGRHWVRLLVWIVVALLIVALATGYVSFATFVASRMVVAGGILGLLYLFYCLIDAFFEGLPQDPKRVRPLSRLLGLKPSSIELIGVVVAGVLKVLLFIIAAFLVIGSWGTSTADVMDTVERISFGIRIGNTTITLWSVVNAILLLAVGLVIARAIQRWISGALLPRTGLEPSLQSSIATIAGYLGVIIVVMISMSELGLSLENVALVAGALSVGIGFGLQAIVSNFVSGLILLAERPIRVGDTINVKGEEGYVRRISVRSTEIETYERASVIVPNSDLITGMVKNWTHTNTTGRVIVTVNVPYDADPEEVRDILVSCACDHPQVLQTPPARVFLTKFTDGGMMFELRCVVANVDYALTVKSDLHFQLLARFRKAGIGLVAQPWAALARAPSDMVPPPAGPVPDPA